MKYCTKCRSELRDDAVLCSKCGFTVSQTDSQRTVAIMQTVAKVLMALSCVRTTLTALALALCALILPHVQDGVTMIFQIIEKMDPLHLVKILKYLNIANYGAIFLGLAAIFFALQLVGAIPMTVHYFKAVAKQQPVGVVFKVCSLFVSPVAGILMFVCESYQKRV